MNEMSKNHGEAGTLMAAPDTEVDVRKVFGVDVDWKVPAFSKADERVPDLDESYVFDKDTTLAILAGFAVVLAHLVHCVPRLDAAQCRCNKQSGSSFR